MTWSAGMRLSGRQVREGGGPLGNHPLLVSLGPALMLCQLSRGCLCHHPADWVCRCHAAPDQVHLRCLVL
jgi:hypothetical protein